MVKKWYYMKDRDFIKIQKKTQPIWSLYDQEIPIIDFNYRLKRKKMVREASVGRRGSMHQSSHVRTELWSVAKQFNQ